MTSTPDIPRDLRVGEIAKALGLTVHRRRFGPCPACGAGRTAKDKRLPVHFPSDELGWCCSPCNTTGDAIDLIAFCLLGRRGREAGRDFGQVLAWLADRHVVELQHPSADIAPRVAPVDALDELRTVLRACRSPADVPEVEAYLRGRAINPAACPAGVLPASFVASVVTSYTEPTDTDPDGRPVVWWPSGWSRRWPLVVPAVDVHGVIQCLHARHVPGYGPPDDADPKRRPRKSTWPRDLPAQGLVFADPRVARPWLRGASPGGQPPAKLLVAEGITDFLAAATSTLPDLGVLGIESGSASAFTAMPWVRGQAVYLATDPDHQGREYAEAVRTALALVDVARRPTVYTVPLRALARAAA